MKYALLFLASLSIAFLYPFTSLQAQDKDSSTVHIVPDGSKAIQFGISNIFRLSSFSGATFAYKKQISSKRARRISFGTDNEYMNYDNPDSINSRNEKALFIGFWLEHTWLNYLNPNDEIKIYYGFGPGLDVAYGFNKYTDSNTTRKVKELNLGVFGVGYFGCEWFFKPRMSVHAEYSSKIVFENLHATVFSDDMQNPDDEVNIQKIRLSGEPVLFGLSVYF